jgi:hypothetical protein
MTDQPLTYALWEAAVMDSAAHKPIRNGQAVMNNSPSSWRDVLPDIYEIDDWAHPDVVKWFNYAIGNLK